MKPEPVGIETLPETSTEVYDSKSILADRRKKLQNWCEKRRYNKSIQFITGYISRYGRSIGNVDFWTCFTPKCASQSFTLAVLFATGFIKPNQKYGKYGKDRELIGIGRNKCPRGNTKCLKEHKQMPTSLSCVENS